MAFEKIFSNSEFTLFHLGEGGGVETGARGNMYYIGGHVYQVEPAAVAAQNNALLFESVDPGKLGSQAPEFVLNFNPSALVYQDKGPLHAQGDFSENGIIEVFDGGDKPAAKLRRLRGASPNFLISENGALWHEARVYQLCKNGLVYCFHVLGYVPAADITRLETYNGLVEYHPGRRDW